MCIHMCPYARFQSAMFDKDTFIVGYDSKRGEKRGPRPRKADPKQLGLGDCIDCDLYRFNTTNTSCDTAF